MIDIVLSDAQAAAVRAIVAWYKAGDASPQEFYLAGFAGVGKSTIARYAIDELRAHAGVVEVRTATFTGKAANVLRKKGVEASTIHGLIYAPIEDPKTGETHFVLSPEGPASLADVIVLDEVSMVNEEMAADIRSFGKKILVMGDPGQLPPVTGQGAFTLREPDVFLTEIHRQAADSPILRIATLARKGEHVPIGDYGQGVRVLLLTKETAEEVYRERTQAICGVHKARWTITQNIRQRRGFEGNRPAKGERLICRRNNRELGIFNGGLGDSTSRVRELADGEHFRFDATMEDLVAPLKSVAVHPYLFDQHFDPSVKRPMRLSKGILEFDWGYCLTAHASQGSEFEDVTVVDDSGSFRDDRNKWLYTAATRASERLTLLKRAA